MATMTETPETLPIVQSAIREDEHPLDSIPELKNNNYHRALKALGYLTLEQLMGAAEVSGQEMGRYLKVPLDQLFSNIPTAATTIPSDVVNQILDSEYALGFAVETIPSELLAPPTAADLPEAAMIISPPPSVNLITQMPGIRDQGNRGTCVAHAAVAALEHYLGVNGAYQDMSEQFLYYDCKQNDGHVNSPGTWLGTAVPLLQRDGCCLEATWPYSPNPIPGNEGQGPPPPRAKVEALSYRVPSYKQLPSTSITDIKAELSAGRCVAFSIPVFNSWYRNKWVAYTGDIVMPVPGEVRVGGHAMCFVGYVDLPQNPELGGGRFLLRNSWDSKWGIKCSYGTGYGTIPYRYVASYCMEAYSIFKGTAPGEG